MPNRIKKYSKPLFASTLAIALSGCLTINAKSLDYDKTEKLSIAKGNATTLSIDAGAGFLKVVGDDSLSEIMVTADILAYDENITLRLDVNGDEIELEADANPSSNLNWVRESPRIDLTVRVPSKMILKVDDGSGSIVIKNMDNNVKVKDGSGSMSLSKIVGNVDIDDGSGSLDINEVKGNLIVEDGSGSLDIEQVTGTVEVDDGSGSLSIYDVGGLVTIDDGSGSINVKKLKSGLTIIEEGSGGLKMSDIEGPVSIK